MGKSSSTQKVCHVTEKGVRMEGFLSNEECLAIKKYAYKGGDSSYIYLFILSPIAQYFVDLLPSWVAPNLITLIGLSFPVSATILTLIYNPTLSSDEYKWLYLLNALCIFIYQTMGKICIQNLI